MAGSSNKVWITSVLSDKDVSGALCLCFSLRNTFTSRKLIVVVTDQVSSFNLKVLHRLFDQLIFVNEKWNAAELELDDFVKLFILTLKSFQTCVYLAPTTLAIKNCDDIFEQSDFPSGFIWAPDDELWFFLGHPSLEVFDGLMKILCNKGHLVGPIVSDWAKNQFGSLLDLVDCNYCARLKNDVDMDSRVAMNASIYNIADFPIGSNLDNLDFLPKTVVTIRNQIYTQDVKPLFELLDLNHPYTSSVPENLQCRSFNNEPIAIVGMSCRYPGANNLDEFWNILLKGEDVIGHPPDFRWLPEQSTKRESHFRNTNAGFLKSPVDEFDAKFFGISPLEVSYMDPQQRILHEVVWEGLENAGINPHSLKGTRGGVFVASWATDFKDILAVSDNTTFFRTYMGNSIGNTAARISFLLGMLGPSIATESACSSSMVAVHLACKSLRGHESSIALACGINLILEPFNHLKMEMALSPDGRCKTFDEKANGFVRSEGVGVLVLKRFSDAVRNGDPIWGLIRGSAVAQEGLSKSIGTPTVHCEALAMKQALNDAGIEPSMVSYVETHGTGTAVGDPIEVEAVAQAYHSKSRTEPLLIGSVKTNIGHTESCAGIAGIIKVLLAMKHELIPAHRNFDVLNPLIDLRAVPAEIPLTIRKWVRIDGKSRIAGISSFGITGTDAHAIIEEPPIVSSNVLTTSTQFERPLHIMKISAASKEALQILVERYESMLINSDDDYKDLAFTSNIGRVDFSHRVVVVAKSTEDALKIMGKAKFRGRKFSPADQGKICFLFTGQGSQYPNMAKQLFETSPVFRIHFEHCASILKHTYGIDIAKVLWSSCESEWKKIGQTIYSQTSIFCVEYALLKLWATWGLKADYALGHSLGEFAAAVCAGILGVEDALKLVARRSLLVDKLPEGKMLVVKADKVYVDALLKEFSNGKEERVLDIAAINSNEQTVLAGDSELILEYAEMLNKEGIKCRLMDAAHAFHSKHMDQMLDEYKKVATSIKLLPGHESDCKFISGMFGSISDKSDINAEYWVQHTRQPVRFLIASKTAIELGCTTFVEIGPQPVLSNLMMINGENHRLLCLSSLRRAQMNWVTLLNTLGDLYVSGRDLDWEGFERFYDRKKVCSLPNYPFQGKKYWPNLENATKTKIHPLLGSTVPNASDVRLFESSINMNELNYLKDHVVGSNIIFPGAGYIEMCLAAGFAALEGSLESLPKPARPMMIEDVLIKAPLLLEENTTCQLQTVVNLTREGRYDEVSIKVFRRLNSKDSKWLLHAVAKFTAFPDSSHKQVNFDKECFLETLKKPSNDKIILDYYERFDLVGLNFGPAFKSLQKCWMDIINRRVLAKVQFSNGLEDFNGVLANYIVHPVILDAMMQTMGLLNPVHRTRKHVPMPIKIGKFVWLSDVVSSDVYVEARADTNNVVSALLVDTIGNIMGLMSLVEVAETSIKAIQSILDQQISSVPEFYEETWKALDSSVKHSSDLPKTERFFFDDGFIKDFESKYNCLQQSANQTFVNLDTIAYYSFLSAWYRLGWQPQVGQMFEETELFMKFGIKDEFRKYFAYMCELLEFKGIIGHVSEGKWLVTKQPPKLEQLVSLLLSSKFDNDLVQAFHSALLIKKVGENLPSILKGEVSAVTILFSKARNLPSMYEFYTSYLKLFQLNEGFLSVTRQVAERLKSFQTKSSCKIRILEVGAGTGAMSQLLMDVLDSVGYSFEYTYTDISSAFFRPAEQRFKKYLNYIKFKTLNLEEDPVTQGFTPEYYDLELASEVIHATKDISVSLQNLRMLMKPDSWLLIHETINPTPVLMLLVGGLNGYWRFQDLELRKKHCILSKDNWNWVLTTNGFSVEATFPELYNNHALIFCKRSNNFSTTVDTTNGKTWLVFHYPGHPVSVHLCQKIPRNVISILSGREYKEDLKNGTVVLRKHEYNDYHVLLTGILQRGIILEGIVYCWALDHNITSQEELLQPYFNLTKCVVTLDMCGYIRFSLITNGVTPLGDNHSLHFHASTLWGYTKSLKNEQASFNCRCIDIVDMSLDDKEIQQIFQEIWSIDQESQVAFFKGTRYVPKYVPLPLRINSLVIPKGTDRFHLLLPETKLIPDLKFIPLPKTYLRDAEVEILVKSFALNFRDVLSVIKPSHHFENSNTLGLDFSGIVNQTGSKVTRWKVGDPVYGTSVHFTALPTHITLNEKFLIPLPNDLTFSEAATIPVAYITAILGLLLIAKIKKQDVVLIQTATGGVGLAAIEICKYIGCKIIATAGSKRKQTYLRSIGIRHIFNSKTIEYSQNILNLTEGKGVDVVLNSLTAEGFKEATLAACGNGARFVEMSIMNIWNENEVKQLRPDVKYTVIDLSKATADKLNIYFDMLERLIVKKVVRPIPYVSFNGEDVQEALQYLESAKHIGKVIVCMPTIRKTETEMKLVTPMFNNRSTYLITGGLGGIGLVVCEWMVEKGAVNILLAGRNPPNSAAATKIKTMNSNGARILAVQLDVSNFDACKEILTNKIKAWALPPLRGVMHSAGTLSDCLIENLDWNKLGSTLKSKVDGTLNLHDITKGMALEHFVIFSSTVSLFGTPGQSNHAAANSFEDAFAHHRHSIGLQVATINWGHWAEVGLATEIDVPGIKPLSNLQGITGLEYVLRLRRLQTSITKIHSGILLSKLVPRLATYFDRKVLKESVKTSQLTLTSVEFWETYDSLNEMTGKVEFLKGQLQTILLSTLRMEEKDVIDADASWHMLGMDSLMYVEMRNWIQMLMGDRLNIHSSYIRDFDSINILAESLANLIDGKPSNDFYNKENMNPELRFPLAHTIHYPSTEKQTQCPLVIVHGLFGQMSHWNSIAETIANETNRMVVTFDARSHGASNFEYDLSYELMAADTFRLCQYLNFGEVSLLGHSMGGKTGMAFALKYPEKLDKLVVVDVSPIEAVSESPRSIASFEALQNGNSLVLLDDLIKDVEGVLTTHGCTQNIKAYLMSNLVDNNGKLAWTGRPSLDVLIKNYIGLAGFPSSLLVRECQKPALFLKSENSNFIPYTDFGNIRKVFTNAEFKVVENADHFPQVSNYKGFMESMLPFLRE